jgi:hypothetical protein
MKIVVFDLDETLGYFTEFGIFLDCLKKYLETKNKKNVLTQTDFNNILDIFPEFLRPNIINILNYLKNKKLDNCCHKMMIYTNNTGPREWSHNITQYFENKIGFKLFDQIIAAFKINGKTIEVCRTTHNKTHRDFIKCTRVPKNAEICFIDDMYHPHMVNENIYYINIKPYYHDLSFEHMIDIFLESNYSNSIIDKELDTDFVEFMLREFKLYNYDVNEKMPQEYEIDKIIGKQIITHLNDFFNKSKRNITKKNSSNKKHNKTKKTIHRF